MADTITCPNCGHHFTLSDIQKHQMAELEEKMKKEIEADVRKRAHEWANTEIEKERKAQQEAFETQKKALEDQQKKEKIELENLRKRDEEARKKEEAFLRQQAEFEALKNNLELEKEKAKLEERRKVQEEIEKQANERLALELEKRDIEAQKQLKQRDEQIAQMQRSIEDAKRKWEQGSMQVQGEALENSLKEMLETNFAIDIISDVEKGIKWADLVQEVRNEFGQSVGKIAWEAKNTKNWTEWWIEKLKEDRLRVSAGIGILVTSALPENIKNFWLYRDIWVTSPEFALPLAKILRTQMMEITKIQNSLQGKDEKMEHLYNYLVSPEFKAKIENILDAFGTMQADLDKEKRAMERIWSAREKQLLRVINNTSQLYGDMQGLIGRELPSVDYLELSDGKEIF